MEKGRPQDANNVQPRLGFAYQLNDRTVLRGGAGKYYAEVITPVVLYALEPATIAVLEVANDGRPDFAANPFNGPAPSFAGGRDAVLLGAAAGGELRGLAARATSPARRRACCAGSGEMAPPADYAHVPQTWQATIGVQRQLGATMAVEADYVYSRGRDEKFIQENVNLSFTNASGIGINNPYTQPRAAAVSAVRHRRDDAVHGPLRVSRAADRVHQAHEQQLAGAARPTRWPGCGAPKGSRSWACPGAEPAPVPFAVCRRPRRPGRLDLRAERPAASRRVQAASGRWATASS